MKVRYFAWMKRTVGVADEDVSPPVEVRTVGDLVFWLRGRSPGHAEALAEGAAFGAAVDKRTATFDVPIEGVREVAFFPPFTGG
ncbi:MAG: MoaD/ThiS family protein [Reyranella sp.]|nr:MoaD/ThiS family protein [Reyranella sp.]MBL6651539.1 MoaD/ThiS family protein [Reyranella sp.]